VIRAVGPQLIGAITTAAGGWWLQTTALAHCSSFVRILLSIAFCICIYLIIVVGLFRLTEPIKVGGTVLIDFLQLQRRLTKAIGSPRIDPSTYRSATGISSRGSHPSSQRALDEPRVVRQIVGAAPKSRD
jgi:hypothetical protein